MLRRIDTEKSVALLVGVSEYDNVPYSDHANKILFESAVANSLIRIENCLYEELDFPRDNVKSLSSPPKDQAIALLANLVEAHQKDELDSFSFYFCGHGLFSGGSFYLGFRDLLVPTPVSGGKKMHSILELLGQIRAKTKFIVLDCCFAGAGLEGLPEVSRETNLRGEINLLGSFSMASAEKFDKSLIPYGSECTAFSGYACDVIESGIEFGGNLISFDEFFRDIRRRMTNAGHRPPIRVSSIDDDLIAVCTNKQYIPEDKRLRFQLLRMSERLEVYGRYFRQSNEAHRQAIQDLRDQDRRVAATLQSFEIANAKIEARLSGLDALERRINQMESDKADKIIVGRRIGWIYIAIIFAMTCAVLISSLVPALTRWETETATAN